MTTTAAMRASYRPNMVFVTILGGLADKKKKGYCYPSQEWLCDYYEGVTGLPISRRTLNRHLAGLERDQLIKRLRRHRRSPDAARGFEMRSTLYTLTRRAMRWLASLGGAARRATQWGKSRVTTLSQHIPLRGRVIAAGASGAPPNYDKSPPDGGGSGKKPDNHLATSTLKTLREVLRRGR